MSKSLCKSGFLEASTAACCFLIWFFAYCCAYTSLCFRMPCRSRELSELLRFLLAASLWACLMDFCTRGLWLECTGWCAAGCAFIISLGYSLSRICAWSSIAFSHCCSSGDFIRYREPPPARLRPLRASPCCYFECYWLLPSSYCWRWLMIN